MKKNMIQGLIDFMLGPQSPYCQPNERRTRMGGTTYGSPNFTELLEAVSFMIMHCHTSTFTKESPTKPPQASEAGYSFDYTLDDQIVSDLILHPEFLKIAVKNANNYIGYAFAHLSYKNIEVSKAVAEQLLKTINAVDYEKIEAAMGFARPYLSINDDIKLLRAEWILGFSCPTTNPNTLVNKLNKFGVCVSNSIMSDVHTYITPINERKAPTSFRNQESLLALLWRYRGKMDFYVVNCLSIFLQIVDENEYLA